MKLKLAYTFLGIIAAYFLCYAAYGIIKYPMDALKAVGIIAFVLAFIGALWAVLGDW